MNTRTGEFVSREQVRQMERMLGEQGDRVQHRFTLVSPEEYDLIEPLPANQRPKALKKHRYKTRRKQSR